MRKFFFLALTALSLSSSAFAADRAATRAIASRDAKVACSSGKTLEQAQFGISLSASSYARAGYRVSSPAIRHADGKILMCISVSRG
ncbi:MAG: hypothetical protein JST04_04395 [Bdellovibrionales bacterium]|nr:hypothetical protein [Bdellovibrionales bacterium]